MSQSNISIYDKLEELFAYVNDYENPDEERITVDLFLILASALRHIPADAVRRLRNALSAKIETRLPGYVSRTFADPPSPTSVADGI